MRERRDERKIVGGDDAAVGAAAAADAGRESGTPFDCKRQSAWAGHTGTQTEHTMWYGGGVA